MKTIKYNSAYSGKLPLSLLTALILLCPSVYAQNDSVNTYFGFEFDITVTQNKNKIVKSSDTVISSKNPFKFSDISAVTLYRDTIMLYDGGRNLKYDYSQVLNVSVKKGRYSALSTILGASLGLIAGGLIGSGMTSQPEKATTINELFIMPSKSIASAFTGILLGALVGAITGGVVGWAVSPSDYEYHYINSNVNQNRRAELKRIFEKEKFNNPL
ncbi:MAG: hypothetical protein NTV87_03715 [Ignavibacteriae bacterium]|nr:hypothetical protein [Ignavibacteriota bacterium]